MELLQPAAAQLFFRRNAGVGHPLGAEIVTSAVRRTGPDELRQAFQELAKTGFAGPERIFLLLPLRNIPENDGEEFLAA